MENNDLVGLIPAAGRGIRISSYSKNINKTLLRIEGKPIIENIIEIMRDALQIKEIYVLVGYRKEDVIGQLKDGKELGVRIHYVEIADVAKGLAQGIVEAEGRLPGARERFDQILTRIMEAHARPGRRSHGHDLRCTRSRRNGSLAVRRIAQPVDVQEGCRRLCAKATEYEGQDFDVTRSRHRRAAWRRLRRLRFAEA